MEEGEKEEEESKAPEAAVISLHIWSCVEAEEHPQGKVESNYSKTKSKTKSVRTCANSLWQDKAQVHSNDNHKDKQAQEQRTRTVAKKDEEGHDDRCEYKNRTTDTEKCWDENNEQEKHVTFG